MVKENSINNLYVIVPSYNEVRNVSILVKRLIDTIPFVRIVIVDDSNPLENRKLRKFLKKYKRVKLLSRLEKKGRGSAVLLGFKEALKDKTAEYMFEMDSDLAHDPKEMRRFIKKIKSDNYDMMLGSRYLKGGRAYGLPVKRRTLSKFVNLFLRVWLNVNVSDFTGGFRLYNRRSVEFLTKAKIESSGFITLSETLYHLDKNGFKVGEVPITINARRYGESTVNLKELRKSLFFVLKMRIVDLTNFKFR